MPQQNPFLKKTRIVSAAIILVLILLILSLILLLNRCNKIGSSSSPGNVISSGETQVITMEDKSAEGKAFRVSNMFPGDRESQEYVIKLTSGDVLAISLGSEIQEETGKLSDVLSAELKATHTSEMLYDGLLKNLVDLRVPVRAEDESVSLTLTVYLNETVSNEYMSSGITAKLSFWVAEKDLALSDGSAPSSRQAWPIVLGVSLGAIGLGGLIWLLLFLLRRKGKEKAKEAMSDIQGGA